MYCEFSQSHVQFILCWVYSTPDSPEGVRKTCSILLCPCVWPHELLHFISTLHGPRIGVTLKAQYKKQTDSAVLTLTQCPASPLKCSERPKKMYLKWSSPSRWSFKQVPDQRHLGRDRMAAAFRPGQSLTRTKKQACSRPLLLSPC